MALKSHFKIIALLITALTYYTCANNGNSESKETINLNMEAQIAPNMEIPEEIKPAMLQIKTCFFDIHSQLNTCTKMYYPSTAAEFNDNGMIFYFDKVGNLIKISHQSNAKDGKFINETYIHNDSVIFVFEEVEFQTSHGIETHQLRTYVEHQKIIFKLNNELKPVNFSETEKEESEGALVESYQYYKYLLTKASDEVKP